MPLRARPFAALLFALAGAGPLAAPEAAARELVAFPDHRMPAGAIIVRTGERRLYLITRPGEAIRYRIAVGQPGRQWFGVKYIEEMQAHPAWSPPASVKRDKPWLPDLIAGGAPNNPMGARALGLGPTGQYAIHGTNRPDSIGRAASYGCFRMLNEDIIDLYARVRIGTPVLVTR
jgi:lipoprotein-anchoring transpeptidase ErfK/SrfK